MHQTMNRSISHDFIPFGPFKVLRRRHTSSGRIPSGRCALTVTVIRTAAEFGLTESVAHISAVHRLHVDGLPPSGEFGERPRPRLSCGALVMQRHRRWEAACTRIATSARGCFRARLTPVVNSAESRFATVPAASNCSMAIKATPTIMVASDASNSVNPLRSVECKPPIAILENAASPHEISDCLASRTNDD